MTSSTTNAASNQELTMTVDDLLALHPPPWTHHLLLIKDANGNQVIHTGGLYSERGRLHEGKYLSGLNALLVELVNSRVSDGGVVATDDDDLRQAFTQAAIEAHVGFQHRLPWEDCDMAVCDERKRLINRFSGDADPSLDSDDAERDQAFKEFWSEQGQDRPFDYAHPERYAAFTKRYAPPAATASPAAQQSPILAFGEWVTRWVADNGRKLTQDEYGIAYAAFIAAHPGEGPQAHVMSPAAPKEEAHRCPSCGRRMQSDFDPDVGMWYECHECDYREAVSNRPTANTPM